MLARLMLVGLLPAGAGCATVSMMRALPPDAGPVAQYAASPDTLAAAAARGVEASGLVVMDDSAPDAWTRIMIAGQQANLFSYGEYVRIRIDQDPGTLTAMHVVTKSGSLLEFGHRERAFAIFQSVDQELGAPAIGPWPGMRVRVSTGRSTITGTVVRASGDALVLASRAGDREQTLHRGDWTGVEVSRGTYGHGKAGMMIGMVLGAVIGAEFAKSMTDPNTLSGSLGVLFGIEIGAAVGGFVIGKPVGDAIRTEVWSAVRQP